ncbi:MAG: hypothetical protein V1853_02090 [bacterium]
MHYDLDGERVKYWMSEGSAELRAMMEGILFWNLHRALAEWDAFYKIFFDKNTLLAEPGCYPKFKIPDFQPGFDRLIVVAQGITLDQVIKACQCYFVVGVNLMRSEGEYDRWLADLQDDRTTEQSYAILVRDSSEADPGLEKKSANQLADERVLGMTLLERMLFELKYYAETGRHLDGRHSFPDNSHDFSMPSSGLYDTSTLITGTRSGSNCYSVTWRDCSHVFIDWEMPDTVHFQLRARQVICVV